MKKPGFLFVSLLALVACQKDAAAPAPSRTELLTTKNWRISAATSSRVTGGAAPVVTDDYATFRPCERDNFSRFDVSKVLLEDEGASKCDPNDPQLRRFTWAFNAAETQLIVTTLTSQPLETDDIVELSATMLRLRSVTMNYPSTTTTDVTFTAF